MPLNDPAHSARAAQLTALPVLDLTESSGRGRAAFLQQLRDAASGPGFFYLVGHGVPTGLAEHVLKAAGEFFSSPLGDRLRISNLGSPHFRGYCGLGAERTGGIADQRDQLDVGPELPARFIGPDDPPWWRLEGPNLWPPHQPELRGLLLTWSDLLTDLADHVLRLLALSLELPADWFDQAVFSRSTYPPEAHPVPRADPPGGTGRRCAQGLRPADPPAAGRNWRLAGAGG